MRVPCGLLRAAVDVFPDALTPLRDGVAGGDDDAVERDVEVRGAGVVVADVAERDTVVGVWLGRDGVVERRCGDVVT